MMERIRQRKGEEGLTLIEILIVIIVLGILSGIVIFGVSTFREDSALAACRTDYKSYATAAEAFRAKVGNYPATAAAMVPDYLKSEETSVEYAVTYTRTSPTAYTLTATTTAGVDCTT